MGNSAFTLGGGPEKATISEINAGSDDSKFITPHELVGSSLGQRCLSLYTVESTTPLTTGDGKAYIRIPSSLNGHNIISVSATLISATSTSGIPAIMIARGRQSNSTTIHSFNDVLSTGITIDVNDWDSKDAATPSVINASYDDLLTGDLLRIDIDAAGTGAQGLIVNIITSLS